MAVDLAEVLLDLRPRKKRSGNMKYPPLSAFNYGWDTLTWVITSVFGCGLINRTRSSIIKLVTCAPRSLGSDKANYRVVNLILKSM
jgi:hypothetical protein